MKREKYHLQLSEEQPRERKKHMFIKGTFLYTPSISELTVEQGYLHIKEGKTDGFYEEIPQALTGEKVRDYGNAVIIPAFNDLHIHAPQYINRGVGFDRELMPWLETYTFPVEAKYRDIEFAAKAYQIFLRRLRACGTMRFSAFATMHAPGTWELMRQVERSGMRAYIGKVNMDRNSPEYLCEETERSLAETEELICRSEEELKHVKYIITPRFVPATSEKLMAGLGELAEKYDLPVQSHLSENKSEIAFVKELHPDIPTYTEVYDAFGLLRKGKTIMAHAIHLSDREKELLKEKQATLSHCAQSNADLSSGVMPVRRNLEFGLDCVIASDVAGSHTPAMNRHLAMCIEVSKLHALNHPQERPLQLAEALYLATKKPGRFFGKVGSFEKGYEFDALVIDMAEPELSGTFSRTPFETLEQFIYDGDDRNIKARYCAGELLDEEIWEK